MHVVRLSATSGSDGVLHLDVPVGAPGEFEVAVVIAPKQPASHPPEPKTPEELGWPPGYMENVLGSIGDDAFVAPPRTSVKAISSLDQE